jgi:hypothetical protein
MNDYVVLLRILIGWAGVYLSSKGFPPEMIQMVTSNPEVVSALTGLIGQILGGVLAAGQIVWWRLAKRFGWNT